MICTRPLAWRGCIALAGRWSRSGIQAFALAALLCGVPAVQPAESGTTRSQAAAEWECDWAWQYPNGQPRLARKPVNRVCHPLALTRVDAQHDLLDVVVARTRALLTDLAARPDAPNLDTLRRELDALEAEAGKTDCGAVEQRRACYPRACALRRRIALANPLLSFDEILFAKTRAGDLSFYSIFDRDKQHAGELVFPKHDFDPANFLGLDGPVPERWSAAVPLADHAGPAAERKE